MLQSPHGDKYGNNLIAGIQYALDLASLTFQSCLCVVSIPKLNFLASSLNGAITANPLSTILKIKFEDLSEAIKEGANLTIDTNETTYRIAACNELTDDDKNVIGFICIATGCDVPLNVKNTIQLGLFAKIVSTNQASYNKQKFFLETFDELIQKVTHDLKNPIGSISLAAELLRRNLDANTPFDVLVKRIENAAGKVLVKLDNFRDNIVSDDTTLCRDITEINLHSFLENFVQNKLNITFEPNPNIDLIINTDVNKLEAAMKYILLFFNEVSQNTTLITVTQVKDIASINIITEVKNYLPPKSYNIVIAKMLIELIGGTLLCENEQNNEQKAVIALNC